MLESTGLRNVLVIGDGIENPRIVTFNALWVSRYLLLRISSLVWNPLLLYFSLVAYRLFLFGFGIAYSSWVGNRFFRIG